MINGKANGVANGHARSMDENPRDLVAWPPEARNAVLSMLAERDPEAWARLRGMLAILELPRLRGFESRPRLVEIELTDGEWVLIDSVRFHYDEISFGRGLDRSWVIPLDPRVFPGIPRWRQLERGIPRPTIEDKP